MLCLSGFERYPRLVPLKVLERKSEIVFNFSKGTVFCTRNRHKQKDIMKTMNTFPKYPENSAFIIRRIVFRRGRRQET